MTNKEIKLLTIDEEPNFKNCLCIVCRKNHAEIVLDMGCHQTQLCKDCLQRLKHKLMEKQVRASSNSDEDCISRAELLKAMDTWDKFGVDDTNSLFRLDNLSLPHYVSYIHYDDVIKCIKGMPSIQPKPIEGDAISRKEALDLVEDMTDQFGNKHRVVTEGMISLLPSVTPKPKTDVLDKIRAEIQEQKEERCFDDSDMIIYRMGLDDALYIIDKYKAESEDKE